MNPALKKRIHYAKSIRCLDGKYRRNCVVHDVDASGGMLDFEKELCGKQMVAWVDMSPLIPKVRMCQEHLDVHIYWAEENLREQRRKKSATNVHRTVPRRRP